MRDYVLYYLAKTLHGQGRCEDARGVFRELRESYPGSRWAPIAESQVKSENSQKECPALEQGSEDSAIDCALIRSALAKPDASLKSGEVLLSPETPSKGIGSGFARPIPQPGGSGEDRRSPPLEERADCYFNRRQYQKAKDLLRQLCETPSIPCLTRLSQAAARSQDFETAIEANETLKRRYPRSKVAEEARRKIAFLKQDSGDFAAAIPLLKELVAASRSRDERRHYRERIAWCRFRLGRFKEALRGFDEALGEAETPFSLYWKGKTLAKMGRSREAGVLFRDLAAIYGGTYYGIRAQERLGEPSASGRSSVRDGINWFRSIAAFGSSEDLERIYELKGIGWMADAEVEARRIRLLKGIPLPTDLRRLTKSQDGDFIVINRTPNDEMVDYPLPYADAVFSALERGRRESGPPAKIDPYLVYAMMRQESRYRETVVSPAGAVGLLQIMPTTGLKLAKEDGWPEYQVQWLYDPETNIELGVRYLQKLWGLLDGRWYAVVASYNAGENVVAEWLKQRPGLPEEEFIEEIPYRETRDYVKRVYSNWKAYRSSYGAD